ncbi:hypothetical protein BC835DRAFT_1354408 [Cytidiella melzeri]|nr:hypothetical protein BC835DRAFT_1354408 [Cytidiella melzeri]
MSPRKASRRCHWYNDDGTQRGIGCTRRECMFVHPHEPEWSRASQVPPPRGYESQPSDHDRDTIRKSSTYSDFSGTSSSSSAFLDRKASGSSTRQTSMDSLATRTESRDKVASSSTRPSVSRERTRNTDRSATHGDSRGTSAERREDSRIERRASVRDFGRSDKDDKRPERRGSVSSTGSRTPLARPVPLGPSATEAMPPPSTKPPPRPDTAAKDSQALRNEKMEVWVSRIKDMAGAVTARIDYLKNEQDLAGLRRIDQSRHMAEFSVETKRRLEKQREDTEARLMARREELNSVVWRLVDDDFWPVPPRLPSEGNSSEEKFKEVRLTVWDLKDKVNQLSELIQHQAAHGPSVPNDTVQPKPRLSTLALPSQTPDAMEVDEPRPTKRRRLSDEQLPVVVPRASDSSKKDLDVLLDRLVILEGKISEIENEMVQYDQDLSVTVEEKIEDKLANMHLPSRLRLDNQGNMIDTGQPSSEVQSKLRELEAGFEQAGREIEEVATEVASILSHLANVDHETVRLAAENESMKQQLTIMLEKQQAMDEMLAAQKTEIKALNAALSAYISRPPDPVPPPQLPDIRTMVEALRPSLMASVRENISPMLQGLRDQIEKILLDHTTELSKTVMTKLGVVLRTQNAIRDFMEQQRQAETSPAAASEAASPYANGIQDRTTPINGAPPANGVGHSHVVEPIALP